MKMDIQTKKKAARSLRDRFTREFGIKPRLQSPNPVLEDVLLCRLRTVLLFHEGETIAALGWVPGAKPNEVLVTFIYVNKADRTAETAHKVLFWYGQFMAAMSPSKVSADPDIIPAINSMWADMASSTPPWCLTDWLYTPRDFVEQYRDAYLASSSTPRNRRCIRESIPKAL